MTRLLSAFATMLDMTAASICTNCILLSIIQCDTGILTPSVLDVFLQSRQYLEGCCELTKRYVKELMDFINVLE
jgi:hypothetical protein